MGNLRHNKEPQLLMMSVKKVLLPFNITAKGILPGMVTRGYFLAKDVYFQVDHSNIPRLQKLQKLLDLSRSLHFFSRGNFIFIREKSENFEKGRLWQP